MGSIDGRALHLLAVEYLGCGPMLSAGDLTLVHDRYRALTDWHLGDHLVGAASHWVYERIAFDAPPDIRLLPAGGGPDVADVARRLGVEIWVAAYGFGLARMLAESADRAIDLTHSHTLAA